MEGSEQNELDADYLFENFDQFCHIQFKVKQNAIPKIPTVIKNLNSEFDKVAQGDLTATSTIAKTHVKSKQRNNSKQSKKSGDKTVVKQKPKPEECLKKKLCLNLDDIFEVPKEKISTKAKFRSSRNCNRSTKESYSKVISFMKASIDNRNQGSHFVNYGRRKSGGSNSRSKSKDKSKLATKKKVATLSTLLNERDMFIKRILEEKDRARKSLLISEKTAPITGSTRVFTASNLDSTKRTHTSIGETDNKSKSISYGKGRTESFQNPNNARAIMEFGKQSLVNLGLQTLKESNKKQLSRADSKDSKSSQLGKVCKRLINKMSIQLSTGLTKQDSITRSKELRVCSKSKENKSREKYYLPTGVGYQTKTGPKYNSFAISDDNSTESHKCHQFKNRREETEKDAELKFSKSKGLRTPNAMATLKK
jgi:hypothetical protein